MHAFQLQITPARCRVTPTTPELAGSTDKVLYTQPWRCHSRLVALSSSGSGLGCHGIKRLIELNPRGNFAKCRPIRNFALLHFARLSSTLIYHTSELISPFTDSSSLSLIALDGTHSESTCMSRLTLIPSFARFFRHEHLNCRARHKRKTTSAS